MTLDTLHQQVLDCMDARNIGLLCAAIFVAVMPLETSHLISAIIGALVFLLSQNFQPIVEKPPPVKLAQRGGQKKKSRNPLRDLRTHVKLTQHGGQQSMNPILVQRTPAQFAQHGEQQSRNLLLVLRTPAWMLAMSLDSVASHNTAMSLGRGMQLMTTAPKAPRQVMCSSRI